MKKTYLILSAMEIESRQFFADVMPSTAEDIYGAAVKTYVYPTHNIILATVGIGRTNAAIHTSILIERYQPQIVIFSGIAGALNGDLNIGDVIIADKVFSAEHFEKKMKLQQCRYGTLPNSTFSPFFPENTFNHTTSYDFKAIKGSILTSDIFPIPDSLLHSKSPIDVDVIDMESSAICHTTDAMGINCIIVRAVSNVFDASHKTELNPDNVTLAAKNAAITTESLILK